MRTRRILRPSRCSASAVAIAIALVASASTPAAAQSFLGTGNPLVAGSATIANGSGTTTITVNNPQTVINWTPDDTATSTAPITFQPGGTTATFIMGGNGYAVLNRIIATDQTRAIGLDGTINSFIGTANGPVGGSVYFYAPGGFVLGGGGVINVGSLVLSASPIQFNGTTGQFITGPRNEVVFGQATQAGATITTNPSHQINALSTDSYVAFVAPRIVRTGNIGVNGQAAMVAAEAATIRFAPDGLFDIEVTSGTSQSDAMTGGGTISGEASSGAGDNNRIYMVAVPKNQAMTLAISQGANLGFQIAGAANVDGNAIVLSAGHDIVNGAIQSAPSAGGGTGAATINAAGVTATSAVTGQATGNINVFSNPGQISSFAGNLTLGAPGNVFVSANGNGATLSVAGDLTMNADRQGAGGADATGGHAALYASGGGQVTVAGTTTVTADGFGGATQAVGATAGAGTGGKAWIQAEGGGTISLNGSVVVHADGYGGSASGEGGTGGTGTGGETFVRAFGGTASLTVSGPLVASASGFGGQAFVDGCVACNGIGGAGIGGNAAVTTSSGTNFLTVSGNAIVRANGTGGDADGTGGAGIGGGDFDLGITGAGGAFGNGSGVVVYSHLSLEAAGSRGVGGGGDFDLGITGAVASFGNGSGLVFDSDLTLEATGSGGVGVTGDGGAGTGGRATSGTQVGTTSGSLTVDGALIANVSGYGGGANGSGTGGTGTGGTTDNGGEGATVNYNGSFSAIAEGAGGYSEAGQGGGAVGGRAWLYAAGANVTVGSFAAVDSSAFGGSGGTTGGQADGGFAFIGSQSSLLIGGSATALASAQGGTGFGGNGGDALAGDAEIRADGGTMTVGSSVFAQATGRGGGASGTGNASGDGFGGSAIIRSINAGSLSIEGLATADATGFGGYDSSSQAASGNGFGGYASLRAASGGDLTVGASTEVRANGHGGMPSEGFSGGSAGNGFGGEAEVYANGTGSVLSLGNLRVEANGIGSLGFVGAGGDGFGGTAELWAQSGGNVTVSGNLFVDGNGVGGYDAAGFGGGDGFGGDIVDYAAVSIYGTDATTSILVTGLTQVRSSGFGGESFEVGGGTGGAGYGGDARIVAATGTIDLTTAQVEAVGEGGDTIGGSGGYGEGGAARIDASGGTIDISGPFTTVSAAARGGDGATGGAAVGGGNIASATGGARLSAGGTGQLTIAGAANVIASGVGGAGSVAGGAGTGGVAQVIAGNGGDIDLLGRTIVNSDGIARLGAIGRGGLSRIFADAGSTIGLFELNLRADGSGGHGNATVDAGDGFGGTAELEATGAGASISVAQQIATGPMQDREMLSADGFGGNTGGGGDAKGGLGTGGTLNLKATAGGNVALATAASTDVDQILVRVRGYGGLATADSTTGGDAIGGNINVVVDGGATMTTGRMQLSSYAQGGGSTDVGFNASGGNGSGGSRLITVQNGSTLNTWIPGGVTGGSGGEASGTGVGGNGSGGVARLTVTDSTLNILGTTIIVAQNTGGTAAGTGAHGSTTGAQVATANIQGSTVNIASGATLLVAANGFGGPTGGNFLPIGTGPGGNGVAGVAQTNIFNSTITGGTISTSASAQGGAGTSGGGNATAGTASVNLANATINAEALTVSADAIGGAAGTGSAGDAVAGTARLNALGGNSIVTLGGSGLLLSAVGDGGAITGASGIAGDGTGGTVNLFAGDSNLTVNGDVNLQARGMGGSGGVGGTGGNGLGGYTTLTINSPQSITINGTLQMIAPGVGGAGAIGGNAVARTTPVSNEFQITAAQILADGGGTISVNGSTLIDVAAIGGAGTIGDGGDASGGEVDIAGMNGTTTLGALTINANATGGAGGSAGGAGGDAFGGYVDIIRGLSSGTISGPLNFGAVNVTADAIGGAGGVGTSGLNGAGGGAGGNALGGQILFTANAAGSSLNSGNVSLSVTATGGRGGDGGSGSSGNGGNGGTGGTARGGFIQSGSVSNDLATGAGASMTTGNLTLNSSAFGGNGGAGGTGITTNGAGGAGGDAFGGTSIFGIRGISATVGDITLFANATGGNGGNGSTTGDGGDATNGLLTVESKDRFNHPTQRGTLAAGNITGRAIATAGSGGTSGATISAGGSYFRVLNGDATIASVDLEISGGATAAATADYIAAIDGTATIIGDFRFVTTNSLSLFADNGSLSAATLTAWAANFVPDTGNEPPVATGTFFADTFDIVTGNNFTTSANLDSANLLEIIAPGSITVNDIDGGDAVYLNAQSGSIAANDIAAVGEIRTAAATGTTVNDLASNSYIYANTGGQLTLNNATAATGIDLIGTGGVSYSTLTSGTYVYLNSTGPILGGNISAGTGIFGYSDGSISLGVLDAGGGIELLSFGDLTLTSAIAGEYIDLATYLDGDGVVTVGGFIHTGNLTAGDSIEVRAGTNAELGDLSAGLVNPSADPFAEYTIGVLAEDYIVAGNVASTTHAGFASPGTITVGDIDVGGIFMVLGGNNIATGAITAGTNTYFGNYTMMALGGSLTDNFDPAPILAAVPTATGGSIGIGGPVDTGDFRALAGGTFNTGAIMASGLLEIRSNGNLTTGNLDAGTQLVFGTNSNALAGSLTSGGTIDARSAGTGAYGDIAAADGLYVGAIGALSFGAMTAGETARFGSDTSISGGNVTAGNSVIGTSGGDATLGNLSAGLVNPSTVPGALYEAVVFGLGDVSVGSIEAIGEVQLAGRDSIAAGNVSTPSRMFAVSNGGIGLGNLDVNGTALIGGFGMFAYTGNLRTDFDASPTFDSAPAAIGGAFTAGDIATGGLSITALGDITVGDLLVDNSIFLLSEGDLTTGDLRSYFSSITLLAFGDITAGDLTSFGRILVNGSGTVITGDLRSGVVPLAFGIGLLNVGPGSPVEVFGNNVATGTIIADGYVGLYAQGTLTAGSINATHDVIALAGGNAAFDGIVTNERFILAGYGNFASLQTPPAFNPEAIFAISPPTATGGNATFGGSVIVSTFESYVSGNTSAGPVRAASFANFISGGTITLNGPVSAQDSIGFLSSDIDITANATVSANEIFFGSISPSGTFIGDNAGGTGGYRLSQAEIDRTDAATYEFGIWTDRGGLGVMTIGDLTMDLVGSIYADVAEFFVGNGQTNVPGGIIRVVGDTSFRVTPDQQVSFEAGTIAVNAETGSIALEDGQGNLSGYLGLYAPNIFVASGDILSRLEQNPRYTGYVDDLNAPAAVQRPDGVIRAASMEIDSFYAPLANILVQNTGTSALPAGFLITDADIGDGESIPEPGSINLVINGQIVTEGGTRTGIDVRDDLVAALGTEPFVAGSTINGCLLTGGCSRAEELPPAAVVNPTQIDLLTSDPLGETEFGNEPDIDDNIEGDGDGESGEQGSPIAPPQPLFDTRPLIDASLIDDPISGAGNPSLYGSDQDDDDDDDGNEGGVKADDKPAKGEDK